MRLPPQLADFARARSVGIAPAALTQSRRLTVIDPYTRREGGSDGGNYRCYRECFDWCFLAHGMPGWYCDMKCRQQCG